MDRRAVLGMLTAGLAWSRWRDVWALESRPGPAGARTAANPRAGAIERVGIQLYTVRAGMQRDFEGTLARIAEIGYQDVEFAGYFGRTPAQVRAALNLAGLAGVATHIPGADVAADPDRIVAETAEIGCQYLVAAWIDQGERQTIADWQRWAERFNRTGEKAKAAGIRFAYHNHDYEFGRLQNQLPYDVLIRSTDSGLVSFEMDLYWLIKAGHDPLAYFARYGARFPLLHVKDSAGAPEHRMVDVGDGSIDFRRIFSRREQAGVRHYFVEHDEPPNAMESARRSFAYMRGLEIP